MRYLFVAVVVLFSVAAQASTPSPVSIESSAMGGEGCVVGSDMELLSNPALMDYRGTRFSIPALTLTLSDPRPIISTVQDSIDFFKGLDNTSAQAIRDFVSGHQHQSLALGVTLFPSLQLSTGIGTFGVGVFAVSNNVGGINPGALSGLADLYDVKAGLVNGQVSSTSITIDKPIDILSLSDLGAVIGYSKKFNIADVLDLSGGIAVRGFERFMFAYAPSASFGIKDGKISATNSSII